ncbi:MAG: proline dehydrogenase family protein, partial [Proteobacteria bacterium]|nr:proline dehydrogenase family protein [Pseudomonadota bacterium]
MTISSSEIASTLAERRKNVREALGADETKSVEQLLAALTLDDDARRRIGLQASKLVAGMRNRRRRFGGLDDFLAEYSLSTEEGVALMCIAEALLRIPDPATADRLIGDKMGSVAWKTHLGSSDSVFVNASTWALMLTGEIVRLDPMGFDRPASLLEGLVARLSEPVIRQAMMRAMRVLGRQFVMGRTIAEALDRARDDPAYIYSYDMLGEAARTAADAERYFAAYVEAARAIGGAAQADVPADNPGMSVKLSALHPRFEYAQSARAVPVVIDRVRELAKLCRDYNIGLTVDAEEAERLDISLDVIAAVAADPALTGWDGFGLAVQAYQTRGMALIDWLGALAEATHQRLCVRLVKGAYWDTEIKRAQERGLAGYPVFTRKASTDLSYLVCAERLLGMQDRIFSQFATHNARTAAAVLEMAGNSDAFEFQRLHGMGEPLYDQLVGPDSEISCRVYAPVGSHENLLPYLVR